MTIFKNKKEESLKVGMKKKKKRQNIQNRRGDGKKSVRQNTARELL
jgi:hypothetical protein